MNPRLAIAIVCLAIAGYILAFFCEDAFGAQQFTVDSSTALHLGVSAGIGGIGDAIIIKVQGPKLAYKERWKRRVFVGLGCLTVGGVKEAIDPVWDWGDFLIGDLGGCVGGISVAEGVMLTPTNNGVVLTGTW